MSQVKRSEDEWRQILTPEQYAVLREKGTERAFAGALLGEKRAGTYRCAGCGETLFQSASKFESGSGWPSFFEPIAEGRVCLVDDHSHGMHRIEVCCGSCEGHLGHVFPDGPPPTHTRYCINSASLTFEPAAPESQ